MFPAIHSGELFYYVFTGLRFDIVALLYVNVLYIIMMSIPFRFRRNKSYNRIADIIFIITNSVLLIPNLVDSIYYRFTLKRMTADIFTYISTGSDTVEMMPQFIHDFWFILLILIALILLIILITKKIRVSSRYVMQPNLSYYPAQFLSLLFFMGLALLGVRGGIQLKPISPLNATQYAPAEETPVVLNSAFTIMRTFGQKGMERISFFKTDQQAAHVFNPLKNYRALDSDGNLIPMQKRNIFIIILESFSAEHIGTLNGRAGDSRYDFTPFIDSLINVSAVYQGFANGKRSIEGIPAVLASLPTWMNEDFITSQYNANQFNSLAGLLKREGYHSAFFHGGKNGTMGFDSFCKSAGFDQYFGKNEYPDQNDFDGHWGIWDEPYLQYVANELNTMRKPFVASVFTLSSHHPYKVPPQYSNKFRKGPLPIQQTIMYSDFALRKFFKTVSSMPWFSNTLFVITADHTSEAYLPFFKERIGQYYVPIIFFDPQNLAGQRLPITAQQTDIMPTLLDIVHFPYPFIAFGNSLLRPDEPHFSLSVLNGNYQLIQDQYVYRFNPGSKAELYNFVNDSTLSKNLVSANSSLSNKMDTLVQAIRQQYTNRLIGNALIAH